jgi:tight adherence protein C
MLLVLAFGCFGLAVIVGGRVLLTPQLQRQQTFERARAYGGKKESATSGALGGRHAFVWGRLAALGRRLGPRSLRDSADLRLHLAGVTERISATDLFAAKVVLGAIGAFIGAIAAHAVGVRFVFAVCLGISSFMAPDAVLALRKRSRRRQMLDALPDSLDMLGVSVEAGLGYEGAVAKLVEHTDGPLAEALQLMLTEIRIGEDRHSALHRFAERVDLQEAQSLASAVSQSEQLGSSMAQILRVQAADARRRRHAAAEERAMRAPVKMIFPTAVFIFPAMFLVILGPAVITISRML